jgi:hypothetical protein
MVCGKILLFLISLQVLMKVNKKCLFNYGTVGKLTSYLSNLPCTYGDIWVGFIVGQTDGPTTQHGPARHDLFRHD